jgi:hypothetical protein
LTAEDGVDVNNHSAVIAKMVPVLVATFTTAKNTTMPTRLNCGYSLISLLDNKDQDSSIVHLALKKSILLSEAVLMAKTLSGDLQTTALNVLLSLCDKASERQLDQIVKPRLLSVLKILVEDTDPNVALIASEIISQICAGGSSEVLAAIDEAELMATLMQLSRNDQTAADLKKAATESVLFYFHSSTIEQALEHIDRGAMEIVADTLLLPDESDLVQEALLVLQLLLGTTKFVDSADFEIVEKSMDHADAWTHLTTLSKESTDGEKRKLAEMLTNRVRLGTRLADFEADADVAEKMDDQEAFEDADRNANDLDADGLKENEHKKKRAKMV